MASGFNINRCELIPALKFIHNRILRYTQSENSTIDPYCERFFTNDGVVNSKGIGLHLAAKHKNSKDE
jgi:hypothetical protein